MLGLIQLFSSKFPITHAHNHNVVSFSEQDQGCEADSYDFGKNGQYSLTLEKEEDAPAGCFNNKKTTKQRLLKLLLQALE